MLASHHYFADTSVVTHVINITHFVMKSENIPKKGGLKTFTAVSSTPCHSQSGNTCQVSSNLIKKTKQNKEYSEEGIIFMAL